MKTLHIALLVIGVGFAGVVFGAHVPYRHILDARQNAVAYSDGSAEILVEDSVPDQVEHLYTAKVSAIGVSPYFYAPTLVSRGGAWQRQVYTFDNVESDTCQDDIFYMDRVAKTAMTLHTDACILDTLDEHDITHFIGVISQAGFSTPQVAVGRYVDGVVETSLNFPEGSNVLSKWAFNWELNKAVLLFGTCSDYCGTMPVYDVTDPVLYSWDLSTNVLTPIEMNVPFPQYGNLDGTVLTDLRTTSLRYDHDSDSFFAAFQEPDMLERLVAL